MKVKKAIFPVGGLGTRFLPATKVIPKEMLPIFNKPIIQYAIEEAKNAGIEEFLFITNRGKITIEDYFDVSFELEHKLLSNNKSSYYNTITDFIPKLGSTLFIRQQQALGLGHAILCAKSFINNEPFVVILPDEVIIEKDKNKSSLREMINIFYEKQGKAIVLSTTKVPKEEVSSYGVFDIESQNNNIIKAKSIVEKPDISVAPSNYINIGRYILPPEILDILALSKPTLDNEIQLTEAIDTLLQYKELYAYIIDAYRFDCGTPLGLLNASLFVASRDTKNKQTLKNVIKKYIKL